MGTPFQIRIAQKNDTSDTGSHDVILALCISRESICVRNDSSGVNNITILSKALSSSSMFNKAVSASKRSSAVGQTP
ncbi:hypothetical protein Plhal304r1_c029g0096121 [Plasmopara halstedii]